VERSPWLFQEEGPAEGGGPEEPGAGICSGNESLGASNGYWSGTAPLP
jgi:hypothetical protein